MGISLVRPSPPIPNGDRVKNSERKENARRGKAAWGDRLAELFAPLGIRGVFHFILHAVPKVAVLQAPNAVITAGGSSTAS